MKLKFLFSGLFFLFANEPSFSANMDGNTLYSWCSIDNDKTAALRCTVYVDGVFEGIQWSEVSNQQKPSFCPPANSNLRQYVDIVVLWLKKNPGSRTIPAAAVVQSALAEVFPC